MLPQIAPIQPQSGREFCKVTPARTLRIWLLLSIAALFSCGPQQKSLPRIQTEALEATLEDLIENSGAEVGLAFRTLNNSHELLINGDRSFHAASTMKIPVMIELYRQARGGRFNLDDPIPVVNEFRSIVDGSPYSLSLEDDSEETLYAEIGSMRSRRRLCEAMIVVSSNLATNILIQDLGVDRIRQTVQSMGAPEMNVLRGVEDGEAYRQGLNNTTTAHALLMLLYYIATAQAVDAEASREMIEILKRQEFKEGIPAGLPEGVEVAHKTGQITAIHHDAGIVYARQPYILVVLTEGLENESESAQLIAQISRSAYEWNEEVVKTR